MEMLIAIINFLSSYADDYDYETARQWAEMLADIELDQRYTN